MSKAFTREDDASDTEMAVPRIPLPPGVPNYLTSDGAARLTARLIQLQEERRRFRANREADDEVETLRRMNANIQAVSQILTSAAVIQPPEATTAEIRFGAFVAVLDELDAKQEYRIVGTDEVDPEKGWVSWRSPLARTLLGKTAGETVQFRTLEGDRDLTVLSVRYAATPAH